MSFYYLIYQLKKNFLHLAIFTLLCWWFYHPFFTVNFVSWQNSSHFTSEVEKQNWTAAKKFVVADLLSDPGSPTVQNNLGGLFQALGDFGSAQLAFELAYYESEKSVSDENVFWLRQLKSFLPLVSFHAPEIWQKSLPKNDTLKFISAFNWGQLMGEQKKVEESLVAYQKALDVMPYSYETKVNIELLINQQVSEQNSSQDGDQNQEGSEGNESEPKPGENNQEDKNKEPKQFAPQNKQQKRYQGQNLSEGDAKKLLDELRQQEEKIRAEFDKQKNQGGRDQNEAKDW